MARSVQMDSAQLRTVSRGLRGALFDTRVSGIDPRELGEGSALEAFDRFDTYWCSGQEALTQSIAMLADAVDAAAEGAERRDAEDAEAFRTTGGQFIGF